jgi:AAA+ superfamily predicted ATPase
MIYTNYRQIIDELNYMNEFGGLNKGRFQEYPSNDVPPIMIRRLRRLWVDRVNENYEATKESSNTLGRFIKKYRLSLHEFLVMIDILETDLNETDMEKISGIELHKDPFKRFNVRFESSNLRRHKIVYRIINPLRPLKSRYEVSYKAQMELSGKKFTPEYEQLDLEFEEESKINSPSQMDSLYYICDPRVSFNELIVKQDVKDKLYSAIARAQGTDQIFKKWGLGKVIEYGRGTTINFRGPPGTGKTLAAGCLAKELGKKLMIVRYDQLQSMWVGQTEKHIQIAFKMAKTRDSVLFFDEADAIALSRNTLERSWEMSTVNTLLKELEKFEGVCIFATNFAEKYDPAFERRLTMHIDFELPTKDMGVTILQTLLPNRARGEIDFTNLNIDSLSGGDLKNVVLNAAGIAVKEKSNKIEHSHIEQAIKMVRLVKFGSGKNEQVYIA